MKHACVDSKYHYIVCIQMWCDTWLLISLLLSFKLNPEYVIFTNCPWFKVSLKVQYYSLKSKYWPESELPWWRFMLPECFLFRDCFYSKLSFISVVNRSSFSPLEKRLATHKSNFQFIISRFQVGYLKIVTFWLKQEARGKKPQNWILMANFILFFSGAQTSFQTCYTCSRCQCNMKISVCESLNIKSSSVKWKIQNHCSSQ